MSVADPERFRVKLTALWRQVFPVATAAAVLSALGRWAAGYSFSFPSTLPLAAVAAVIVLGMHWFRPVQAAANGLLLLHRSGRRRFVPWDGIASAGFGRRLPLEPAFRVSTLDGDVLWIPLHTQRLRDLQRAAVRYGGPSNPLAIALETPICDVP